MHQTVVFCDVNSQKNSDFFELTSHSEVILKMSNKIAYKKITTEVKNADHGY